MIDTQCLIHNDYPSDVSLRMEIRHWLASQFHARDYQEVPLLDIMYFRGCVGRWQFHNHAAHAMWAMRFMSRCNHRDRVDFHGACHVTLPENCSMHTAIMQNSRGIVLPRRAMHVEQDFQLSWSDIRRMPHELTVGGSFLAAGSAVRKLPRNFSCHHLDVSGTKMKSLPQGLRVAGNLVINNSLIDTLPADLELHGQLHVHVNQIAPACMPKKHAKKIKYQHYGALAL